MYETNSRLDAIFKRIWPLTNNHDPIENPEEVCPSSRVKQIFYAALNFFILTEQREIRQLSSLTTNLLVKIPFRKKLKNINFLAVCLTTVLMIGILPASEDTVKNCKAFILGCRGLSKLGGERNQLGLTKVNT